MTIHKKGQAHWEGDIKQGKGLPGDTDKPFYIYLIKNSKTIKNNLTSRR